jgi:hypothetical protein
MDKTERKVLDFMLEKTYSEVVHKSITAYILAHLEEIRSSLKITTNFDGVYPDSVIPEQVFLAIIQEDKIKKELLITLQQTRKKKGDVITEIIKQFGLQNDNDYNYIHDRLCSYFDSHASAIAGAIKFGNYDYIYGKWKE